VFGEHQPAKHVEFDLLRCHTLGANSFVASLHWPIRDLRSLVNLLRRRVNHEPAPLVRYVSPTKGCPRGTPLCSDGSHDGHAVPDLWAACLRGGPWNE
jgi:hypothetical protein